MTWVYPFITAIISGVIACYAWSMSGVPASDVFASVVDDIFVASLAAWFVLILRG